MPAPRSSRRRRGLSVVEVLIALVLVAVGVLGIAGSSALAARASASLEREARALDRAGRRFALLQSEGCGAPRTGESGPDEHGVHERWAVEASGNGVASFEATIEWPDGRALRTLHLESALLC